jgi:hypothetical protein
MGQGDRYRIEIKKAEEEAAGHSGYDDTASTKYDI